MLHVKELVNCEGRPLNQQVFAQVIQIYKKSWCRDTFCNFVQFLLDVAECLLSHHSVIAFIDWDRTVVLEDLRKS